MIPTPDPNGSSLLGDLPPSEPTILTDAEREALLRVHLEQARDLLVQHLGPSKARKLWDAARPSHSARHRPTGTKKHYNEQADELLSAIVKRFKQVYPEVEDDRIAGIIAGDLMNRAPDLNEFIANRQEDSIARRIRTLRKSK